MVIQYMPLLPGLHSAVIISNYDESMMGSVSYGILNEPITTVWTAAVL